MSPLNDFTLDDGYRFGLGVFETVSVKNGKGILLPYHMERLVKGLRIMGITRPTYLEKELEKRIRRMQGDEDVLRISISQNNVVWEKRKNPYTKQDYVNGFSLMYSTVFRNETSQLVGIKSLNQGDNILQKRLAINNGFDEAVFLNLKGEITEGTASNLFFVSDGRLYTPAIECGLLAGTIRRWLIEKFVVREIHILPQELESFQEMFLCNALLGIMPVRQLNTIFFSERKVTDELLCLYRKMIEE